MAVQQPFLGLTPHSQAGVCFDCAKATDGYFYGNFCKNIAVFLPYLYTPF